MPKAANNMGTIRKRKDGRWEARYTAPDGKQRSVYGKTQKAVTEALRAVQYDIDNGKWLRPSGMTMDEWLTIWLRDHQSHTTGRTVETYAAVINKHMRPLFGSVKLGDFATIHARRMVTSMTQAGLSPTTIRHAHAILRAALNSAVEDKLIKSNPAAEIKTPRTVPHSFAIVDRTQYPDFLAAIRTTQYPDALLFLLLTGVRVGEMRGLRWADVDFEAGKVSIRRQLYAPSRVLRELRPPKDGEVRTIYVTQEVVDLLRCHRKAQTADHLRAENWVDDDITRDLVFRNPDGEALTESNVHYAFEKVRKALDMPTLRIHDLRHSYAVAALRSGVDVKTVQHNLGHKHAAITMDIYAAYTDDAGKAAAEKLSTYFDEATR